ncbi:MAG: 2-dehydro-3-deoxy-D-gluconate 5-dehydrogenase KduD [Anaerolineae bacterium]|nr:2-dehydro-3-deoxy-D-gluconate 5-dehydrogenase KduD [Anaerolineae bacterium]
MGVLDTFRLDGQVALVTGCGRGIGQAIAVALAEAGADIAGLYATRYEETEQLVQAVGKRFLPIQCDLEQATVADLGEVIDKVVSELGRLDILVNNSGIVRRTPAVDYPEVDWDAVMQINLKAAFFLAQAAGRVMVAQGSGKIINIASLLSFQGGILVPPYSAAKHGLAGVTKALANEWASLGIQVNAIAPGYIRTDNTAALRANPQRNQALLDRIPAGRWGESSDVVGAAVFLASAASDFVNGIILPVDGGWMAR